MNVPPELARKVGPLPVWGWGLTFVGMVGAFWFLKHHAAAADNTATSMGDSFGSSGGYVGGYGGGGGDSGVVSGGDGSVTPVPTAPSTDVWPKLWGNLKDVNGNPVFQQYLGHTIIGVNPDGSFITDPTLPPPIATPAAPSTGIPGGGDNGSGNKYPTGAKDSKGRDISGMPLGFNWDYVINPHFGGGTGVPPPGWVDPIAGAGQHY